MSNLFMIQNEFYMGNEFLDILLKTGIPKHILEKEYSNENQIILNEHYFKNLYNYFFKHIEYEDFMKKLKENNTEELFKDLKFSVFYYKTI